MNVTEQALQLARAQNANAPTELGVNIGDLAHNRPPPVRRYPSGMPDLDRLIGGGISTRQAMFVMAPPADGKSGLAAGFAREYPGWTLHASTELESHELLARHAAAILGCAWRDVVDGTIPWDRAVAAVANLRIRLVGCEMLPMGEAALDAIEHEARIMTERHGLPPMVILDYLQDLARGTDTNGTRAKIGELAMRLRAMSQRLDCPVVVVSSVSRTYYGVDKANELRKANDPTVYLAAAKESGDVDYAGAVVIFLDVLPPEPGAGFRAARLAVAKSRHGETGFVGARFRGASGRWEPASDDVLASAARREEAETTSQNAADDDRMLRAVIDAARERTYRGVSGWRPLMPGMSKARVEQSIARLVTTGGPLTTATHHPIKHAACPGGGLYVVPKVSPDPSA